MLSDGPCENSHSILDVSKSRACQTDVSLRTYTNRSEKDASWRNQSQEVKTTGEGLKVSLSQSPTTPYIWC